MLLPVPAQLTQPPAPRVVATRVAEAPKLDGVLDDAAWRAAPASTAFTQKFPNEARQPSERTTMRVAYDDEALYVAFDCEQIHAPVVRRLTRRDRQVESDWVSIDLGTRRDGKSAFEFVVNAAGVQVDSIRFNDTDASADWDENWDARTATTPKGWAAEIKIPFRILRFASATQQSWDFQARRHISERQETDEWAFIPRDVAGEVSHYGRIDGLIGIRPQTPIELRPFVLGRLRRRDAADTQLASGTDVSGSVGLDLKWHPTQSLTLDATINPDFAQVEADQVVLNLTTYETYYPERRPFFLEGIDTFSTPRQLLYTRRIGREPPTPTLRDGKPYGERLVDVPTPATIYGASKLTGKLSDSWTFGALHALTGRNDVTVELADRSREERLVDPLTSFNVLRLKRDIGKGGYVGAMATTTAHLEPTGGYPRLPPGAAASRVAELCPNGVLVAAPSRCFNNAYVGSLDWLWRSSDGDYVTGGQLIATVLDKGPPRVVPDGTRIRPGDPGVGLFAYVNKEGGKHWVGDASFEVEGRKLDYNDLGYNQRSNDLRWRADVEYRSLEPWWHLLESHARFEYFGRTTIDGLWIGSGYQANVSGKLDNFWEFFTELHYRPAHFDDREVGDGTALERDGLIGHEIELSTDKTRRVSFSMSTQTQVLFDGFNFVGDAGLLLRMLPQLDLEILPTGVYTFGEPRYVAAGPKPGMLLFGKLDARSLGTTLRATYTFTPRLSLQTYGQLFLASGHYADFSSFQADPAGGRPLVRLKDLKPFAGAPAANPDFEQGVLNINVVLRWEYRLGSTLFVVYTRSQVPSVILARGAAASLDLASVRRAPASDVILVKLSSWFG